MNENFIILVVQRFQNQFQKHFDSYFGLSHVSKKKEQRKRNRQEKNKQLSTTRQSENEAVK